MRALTLLYLALVASPALASRGAGAASGGVEWLGPPPKVSPRRVVSLAPSLTDIVIVLGKADALVGVSRYDAQPEVSRLPRVGGFLDPSPEAVVALQPDLVLWLTDSGALPSVRKIADLGVPVLALPVIGVEDVTAAARQVGRALGDAAAGERFARGLEEGIARVRAVAAGLPRPRVLFVVGREPLVVAGPGSYPDQLLRIAGAENVVKGEHPWPVYPLEKAVGDDPDFVIDAASLEHGGSEGRLSSIPAARRGRLVRLTDDDALRPGPRLLGVLDRLLATLHPQAVAP